MSYVWELILLILLWNVILMYSSTMHFNPPHGLNLNPFAWCFSENLEIFWTFFALALHLRETLDHSKRILELRSIYRARKRLHKRILFFHLCRYSMLALNWILYGHIWKRWHFRLRFRFRANINEPLEVHHFRYTFSFNCFTHCDSPGNIIPLPRNPIPRADRITQPRLLFQWWP